MRDSTRSLSYFLILLAASIGIVAFVCLPWWTVDDAYISYRYGRNLLTNGELTWNLSEPRVEGYTGIFLPLLSSLLLGLGLPLVNGIKVLGIAALLATVGLTYATLRRLGLPLLMRAVVVLLLSAAPILYEHSISGLETIFFTAAMALVWWALSDSEQLFQTGRSAIPLATGLLLAGLSRPEGIALMTITLIQLILYHRYFNSLIFKAFLLKIALIAVLPLMAYWVWRTTYYGAWLPNTFAAKAYAGWINIDSVIAFCKFVGYYCFLPTACAVALGGRQIWNQIKSQKLMVGVGSGMLACCLIAYGHSHLWMNYGSRFFFPFLPMLLIGAAWLAHGGIAQHPLSKPKKVLVLTVLTLQMVIMAYRFKQEAAFLNYYHWIVQDELIAVGEHLQKTAPPGSKVISYMDAGAIGYYSGLSIVDFGRLNDRFLVDPSLGIDAIKDHFFGQEAAFVVMSSAAADVIDYTDEAMAIVADQRFMQYERVGVWGNRVDYPYWQHLFRRIPSPIEGAQQK